eukprot:COSAG01_NODE_1575_length_9856_cov_33.989956_13_plen_171_part_00
MLPNSIVKSLRCFRYSKAGIIDEHYRGVNALGYTIAGDTPQHTECGVILRAAGARDDMVDPRLRNAKNRQSLALCDKKFRKEFKSRKRLYYKDRAAEFKQRQSLSKESLSQDRAWASRVACALVCISKTLPRQFEMISVAPALEYMRDSIVPKAALKGDLHGVELHDHIH